MGIVSLFSFLVRLLLVLVVDMWSLLWEGSSTVTALSRQILVQFEGSLNRRVPRWHCQNRLPRFEAWTEIRTSDWLISTAHRMESYSFQSQFALPRPRVSQSEVRISGHASNLIFDSAMTVLHSCHKISKMGVFRSQSEHRISPRTSDAPDEPRPPRHPHTRLAAGGFGCTNLTS